MQQPLKNNILALQQVTIVTEFSNLQFEKKMNFDISLYLYLLYNISNKFGPIII